MGTPSSLRPPPHSQRSLAMIRPVHSLFSFILILFLLSIPPTASFTDVEAPEISYFQHCNDVVPKASSSWDIPLRDPIKLSLSNARYIYISGNSETSSSPYGARQSLLFRAKRVYKTEKDHVFKLDGVLILRGYRKVEHPGNSTRRGLRLVHYRPPRIPVDSMGFGGRSGQFSLSGFWNSTSGKLCMVGGNKRLSSVYGVIKLDYPDNSTVFTSLVNGTLEIFYSDGKLIDALTILGLNLRNYEYKLIKNEIQKNVFQAFDNLTKVSLGMEGEQGVCGEIRRVGHFDLEYTTDCKTVNCDFLAGGRQNITLPSSMSFSEIECWKSGEVRYLLGFHDGAYKGRKPIFEPNNTLLTEGKWNAESKRLDMVGCQILDGENKSVDCSVRMILWWPAVFTMQQRSAIIGEMWSNRRLNESGYFGRVAFRSHWNRFMNLSGVKYEYTQIEKVHRSCARRMTPQYKGRKYPAATTRDMSFDMIVKNKKANVLGSSSPLFVGKHLLLGDALFEGDLESAGWTSGLVNVSYELTFRPLPGLNLSVNLPGFSSVRISAEGVYNSKSGHLCMIGCMTVDLPSVKTGRSASDCEILIDVQYPQLNSKTRRSIEGTVESTRDKSDILYFEPLEIVSNHLYFNQAKASIWRMDLEIIMVLISNTLACIFVGLQLFYVKGHPNVVSCISLVMLTILTLAHLVPLLLNFEALFLSNHNGQNVYFGSDGWLAVNEVLVRVITMVVFLLEFRLLQLTWSAKVNDESQKIYWISEKKVLYLCLPLYSAGGLIAWFSFLSSKSHGRLLLMVFNPVIHRQRSFWGGLKSYAGLILDWFLFPQILFNLFSDTRERALAPSFYVGTTFVRLLPHAYDLYRVHSSAIQSINYIYANPRMDYYSTAWDIIICVGGLLFVTLVWVQQRFGGRCFLPKRSRQSSTYEKVPVVNTE